MTVFKKVVAVSTVVASTLLMAAPVFAQPAAPTFTTVQPGQAGFRISDFGVLIQGLLNTVLFISALLVFAYLVWGGVQWITSGGDKGKTEEARNKITAAIVGLAVVAASYAIFRVALYVIGVDDPFTTGLPGQIRLYNNNGGSGSSSSGGSGYIDASNQTGCEAGGGRWAGNRCTF